MFLTGDPRWRSKTRLPWAGIRSPFRGKKWIVQVPKGEKSNRIQEDRRHG